jgi:transcriptional regulator with XRE-family HTH domain
VDIKTKIGKRIKELRTEKKYSQEELAARANIDRTYINSVEHGKRNVSIVNIEKIVSALGCSLQEFFTSDLFTNKKSGK